MSRGPTLEKAVSDHRAAIAAVAADLERIAEPDWQRPPRPGKWSPAEVAQHLLVIYGPLMAELAGGPGYRMRLSWWQRIGARWIFLPRILDGSRFPSGVKAPPEARPVGPFPSRDEAGRRLPEAAGAFERAISDAHAQGGGRITHAYLGRLTAPQALKLLAGHAEHHRNQLRLNSAQNGHEPYAMNKEAK